MLRSLLLLSICILSLASCKPDDNIDNNPHTNPIDTTVTGFNILKKLPGIWNGPVTSATPLGGYDEWILDFRPVSDAQVSAKSELDTANDIHMSFFIVEHDSSYKLAFRNGGSFAGNHRIAYAMVDSVSETADQSFYRFVDFKAGGQRVFTNIQFKQDSLIMTVYTNKYNTLTTPAIHMQWKATLRDTSSKLVAMNHFDYPKRAVVKDFSHTFDGRTEAVYYNLGDDPYKESEQPYLGNTTIDVTMSGTITPNPARKIVLILTTEPLFNGFAFDITKLRHRSRYVLLQAKSSTSFSFNYMHPGTYYLNALYDADGNGTFNSGDYISNSFDKVVILNEQGTATNNTNINFQIP
jgi:hypothetical protein